MPARVSCPGAAAGSLVVMVKDLTVTALRSFAAVRRQVVTASRPSVTARRPLVTVHRPTVMARRSGVTPRRPTVTAHRPPAISAVRFKLSNFHEKYKPTLRIWQGFSGKF